MGYKPRKAFTPIPPVLCPPGGHRLRFIALYPGGQPDLARGRWCEQCPYRDGIR